MTRRRNLHKAVSTSEIDAELAELSGHKGETMKKNASLSDEPTRSRFDRRLDKIFASDETVALKFYKTQATWKESIMWQLKSNIFTLLEIAFAAFLLASALNSAEEQRERVAEITRQADRAVELLAEMRAQSELHKQNFKAAEEAAELLKEVNLTEALSVLQDLQQQTTSSLATINSVANDRAVELSSYASDAGLLSFDMYDYFVPTPTIGEMANPFSFGFLPTSTSGLGPRLPGFTSLNNLTFTTVFDFYDGVIREKATGGGPYMIASDATCSAPGRLDPASDRSKFYCSDWIYHDVTPSRKEIVFTTNVEAVNSIYVVNFEMKRPGIYTYSTRVKTLPTGGGGVHEVFMREANGAIRRLDGYHSFNAGAIRLEGTVRGQLGDSLYFSVVPHIPQVQDKFVVSYKVDYVFN